MSDILPKNLLSGFAHFLAESKLLDESTALHALEQTSQKKTSYIEFLVKEKLLDATIVAKSASEYFGLPLFDIESFNFSLIPAEFLNIPLVRKRQALPLFIKHGLL